MLTAHSDARILSRPCRVIFAGWESTTTRLQQAGWSLSAEQSFEHNTIRLAMRYAPARLYMLAESQDFDFYRAAGLSGFDRGGAPTFHIRCAGSDIVVQTMESSFDFLPIDAAPQYVETTRKSIEDFGIFATPLARTEEIIVEPETVMGLLEKIKKLQAPELAAIRECNRMRDRTEPMRRQQFHAQILSLAA